MREYINDPGSIEFWDLNQETIRKAHQAILKEFELALSELSLSAELSTPYKPLLVFGLKMKKAGSVLTAI